MSDMIKVGISSCLLGQKVRYDGQHKLDRYLRDTLGQYIEWYPVCPESECGLPIPREAMSLQGTINDPQLITIRSHKNITEQMTKWISTKLLELQQQKLSGFVFKKKSPSSALYDAKVHNKDGIPFGKSPGLFAKAFIKTFPLIPVEDEGRLHDAVIRENFIESVFIYARWQEMLSNKLTKNSLEEFHKKHKLIIMAHAPSKTAVLGRIASSTANDDEKYSEYIKCLMETLKIKKTTAKNVNVLQHIMGYFKKDLTKWEKEELLKVIKDFHNGFIPIIVPLTLLQHYIKKYNKLYLQDQYYIYQHPAELKLRNHV